MSYLQKRLKMTEQDNFTKDTKQLIIEFVDNCKESFQRLEKLIRLNEDGLMKCFEWSEKSETKLSGLINLFDVVTKKQDGNSIRIEKFENEINSLRRQIEGFYNQQKEIIDKLIFHKNMQIDENRKISKRMDELEKKLYGNKN